MNSELPLTKDPTSRYVPWIVGLMMYLAVLSSLLFCFFQTYFHEWTEGIQNTFTVEIYSQEQKISSDYTSSQENNNQDEILKDQLQKIQIYLKDTPGIIDVVLVDREDLAQLLTPWFGNIEIEHSIDVPFHIEGKIQKGTSLNLELIQKQIQEIIPFSRIVEHEVYFLPLKRLGISLKIFVLILLSSFFLVALVTLSFSVQTSLLIHKPIIDILSLLGASDAFIAKEFKKLALHMALKGGGLAFIILIFTFLIAYWIFYEIDVAYLPLFSFKDPYLSWIGSLLTPFIMGCFMVSFAHYKVKKILAHM